MCDGILPEFEIKDEERKMTSFIDENLKRMTISIY